MPFFLLTQSPLKDPPVPVMVLVVVLCLSLPYLIRRKTGKSLNELLASFTLISWLTRRYEKKNGLKPDEKTARKNAARAAEKKELDEKDRIRRQQHKDNQEWLRFIKETVDFARKNRLFVLVPGNITAGSRKAEYTLLLITRARVIGVMGEMVSGKIICHEKQKQWTCKQENGQTMLENPLIQAEQALTVLNEALRMTGQGSAGSEAAVVFTSPDARLEGEKNRNIMKAEAFFRDVSSDRDLKTGTLEPKQIGQALHRLRKSK